MWHLGEFGLSEFGRIGIQLHSLGCLDENFYWNGKILLNKRIQISLLWWWIPFSCLSNDQNTPQKVCIVGVWLKIKLELNSIWLEKFPQMKEIQFQKRKRNKLQLCHLSSFTIHSLFLDLTCDMTSDKRVWRLKNQGRLD